MDFRCYWHVFDGASLFLLQLVFFPFSVAPRRSSPFPPVSRASNPFSCSSLWQKKYVKAKLRATPAFYSTLYPFPFVEHAEKDSRCRMNMQAALLASVSLLMSKFCFLAFARILCQFDVLCCQGLSTFYITLLRFQLRLAVGILAQATCAAQAT